MQSNSSIDVHNIEILKNLDSWNKKPLLRDIYTNFYNKIALNINHNLEGKIVELGSGIGNLKIVIPEVVCTDIFSNPWIDQQENAYCLSFQDQSISNIVLFDVWHHLQYPGDALAEFYRVLKPNGRIIIFEPYISVLGLIVYGLFHHEPVSLFKQIKWHSQCNATLQTNNYYAAQGNATRMFCKAKYKMKLNGWNILKIEKIPAIYYILSGGYSKKQLYPDNFLKVLLRIDKLFSFFPSIFATRLLVVLEKPN